MKARYGSILVVSTLLIALSCLLVVVATAEAPVSRTASQKPDSVQRRTRQSSAAMTSTYTILSHTAAYTAPFLIDDLRYETKTCFNTRTLTVYRAAHDGAPLSGQPVVFFVHGGGWVDGYASWYDFVARSFTGEMGWVTVVIDYRLTADQVLVADPACQESTAVVTGTKAAWYPDNIRDVADAFRWVVANVEGYGGDPNQIVVFGHSAGGHLASLLATHPDYEALRPAIRGVVSMSGVYSVKDLNMSTFGPAIDQTWPGGHEGNDAELDAASPTTYVTRGMALPPFYVLHCGLDLPSLPEQAIAFQNQLEWLDLPVSADYLAGYGHVSEMQAIEFITETPTALIVAFIEDTLAPYRVYLPLAVND